MKRISWDRLIYLSVGVAVGFILSWESGKNADTGVNPHSQSLNQGALSQDTERNRKHTVSAPTANPGKGLDRLMTDVSLGPHRISLAEEQLRQWALRDPGAALAWVEKMTLPNERRRMLEVVFRAWGGMSIEAALAKAKSDLGAEMQQLAVRSALGGLAESDPKGALNGLALLENPDLKRQLQGELLLKIARTDPASAIGYAQREDADGHTGLRQMILSAWLDNDPRAALSWVSALPEDSTKEKDLLQMASVWVAVDPDRACEYAGRISDPDHRAGFCSSVAAALLQQDRGKAIAWVDSLPDEASRTAASDALCNALASVDPLAAANYAVEQANRTDRTDPLASVVGAWAIKDPAAAGEWVAGFPEGKLKDDAISSLADAAVSQSPEAFGTWLTSSIPASLRDAVISDVVEKSRAAGSAWAADWALQVADSSNRWQSLSGVVRRWRDLDAAAAGAWITNAQIPEGWKGHLEALLVHP